MAAPNKPGFSGDKKKFDVKSLFKSDKIVMVAVAAVVLGIALVLTQKSKTSQIENQKFSMNWSDADDDPRYGSDEGGALGMVRANKAMQGGIRRSKIRPKRRGSRKARRTSRDSLAPGRRSKVAMPINDGPSLGRPGGGGDRLVPMASLTDGNSAGSAGGGYGGAGMASGAGAGAGASSGNVEFRPGMQEAGYGTGGLASSGRGKKSSRTGSGQHLTGSGARGTRNPSTGGSQDTTYGDGSSSGSGGSTASTEPNNATGGTDDSIGGDVSGGGGDLGGGSSGGGGMSGSTLSEDTDGQDDDDDGGGGGGKSEGKGSGKEGESASRCSGLQFAHADLLTVYNAGVAAYNSLNGQNTCNVDMAQLNVYITEIHRVHGAYDVWESEVPSGDANLTLAYQRALNARNILTGMEQDPDNPNDTCANDRNNAETEVQNSYNTVRTTGNNTWTSIGLACEDDAIEVTNWGRCTYQNPCSDTN